jgi:hypothetical protein
LAANHGVHRGNRFRFGRFCRDTEIIGAADAPEQIDDLWRRTAFSPRMRSSTRTATSVCGTRAIRSESHVARTFAPALVTAGDILEHDLDSNPLRQPV